MSHFPLLGLDRILTDGTIRQIMYDIGLLNHLNGAVSPAIDCEAGRRIFTFGIKPHLANHGLSLL